MLVADFEPAAAIYTFVSAVDLEPIGIHNVVLLTKCFGRALRQPGLGHRPACGLLQDTGAAPASVAGRPAVLRRRAAAHSAH